MVSKAITYGALALVGSEATGITNFTGAGGEGGQSPIQMPDIRLPDVSGPDVSIEESGPNMATILSQLQDSQSGSSNQILETYQEFDERTESLSERINNLETQTTQTSDIQDRISNWSPTNNQPDNNQPDNQSDNQTQSESQLDLQDYGTPNDNDFNIGDAFATAGESGQSIGEGIDTGIDTLQKTGRTWAQTGRALAGKKYNTEGTFANNGQPDERRLYQGSLVDKGLGAIGL